MLNNSTVSYIAKLLKSDEKVVKKLTEEEGDRLQLIKHASKKRLNKKTLKNIDELDEKVLFPAHPRVRKMISDTKFSNIEIVEPMGYKEFITNLNNCKYVISDSGGVQCEASVLNTPMITLRDTTEHPDTILFGTNTLCSDSSEIKNAKLNTELNNIKNNKH